MAVIKNTSLLILAEVLHLPGNLLQKTTELENLDLSSNGLTELPDELLSELSRLKSLNLSGNSLRRLPSLTNSEVISLRLSGNNLEHLPDNAFENLTKLEEIDLRYQNVLFISQLVKRHKNSFRQVYQLKTNRSVKRLHHLVGGSTGPVYSLMRLIYKKKNLPVYNFIQDKCCHLTLC